MPTKNQVFYEDVPWATYSGCGYLPQSQRIMARATSVVTMDTLRRPKPQCLACNPTQGTLLQLQEWNAGLYAVTFTYGCASAPNATATVYYPYQGTYYERDLVCVAPLSPDWGGALRKKLKGKAVNLATICGEYRQTAALHSAVTTKVLAAARAVSRMLKGGRPPAGMSKRALKMAERVRKSRSRRIKGKAANVLTGNYLLATFGIAPLLGDLHKSIEKMNGVQALRTREHVSVSAHEQRSLESGGYAFEGRYEVTARAVLYVTWDPSVLRTSGFSGGNPLEVAWELTRLSWVVDYLVSIGEWLAALDALVGVQSYSGTVTSATERTYVKSMIPAGSGPQYRVADYRSYMWREKVIKRSVIGDIPMPPLLYKPSSSYKSLLNSVALLTQLKTARF